MRVGRLEKLIEELERSNNSFWKLCQLAPNSGTGYHRLFIVDCLLCHFDCLLKRAACKLCFPPRLPCLSLSTWVAGKDGKFSVKMSKGGFHFWVEGAKIENLFVPLTWSEQAGEDDQLKEDATNTFHSTFFRLNSTLPCVTKTFSSLQTNLKK